MTVTLSSDGSASTDDQKLPLGQSSHRKDSSPAEENATSSHGEDAPKEDARPETSGDEEVPLESPEEECSKTPLEETAEIAEQQPAPRIRRPVRIAVRLATVWVRGLRNLVRRRGKTLQSGTVSVLVHAAFLLALALWTLFDQDDQPPLLLSAANNVDDADAEAFSTVRTEAPVSSAPTEELASEERFTEVEFIVSVPDPEAAAAPASRPVGLQGVPKESLAQGVESRSRGGLTGRSAERRSRMLRENGGTAESERAVRRGLEWLAYHQAPDGSWNFNHAAVRPHKVCLNPGKSITATGATALALLPFLGAGQTHREGEFQGVVERGLNYLLSRRLNTPHGGDFQDGTMYAQGLAGIALCEAYAMTKDETLKEPAQSAIDFIVYAQDPKGGGWRYRPREPGDTSMLGWQLMALKSARLGYLRVPATSYLLAGKFLNSMQTEYGARYGYDKHGKGRATTAIGLLCRMYLGWRRERPELAAGLGYLSKWGPSRDDMYYNYYATLALHQWGGESWRRWNPVMREHLIAAQVPHGPEAGSWFFTGGHGAEGGRMYNTAMAVMTLEVYYRYLPIYKTSPLEDF